MKGERLEGKKHACTPQRFMGFGFVFRGSGLSGWLREHARDPHARATLYNTTLKFSEEES